MTPILDVTNTPPPRPVVEFIPTQPPPTPVPPTPTNTSTPTGTPTSSPTATDTATPTPSPTPSDITPPAPPTGLKATSGDRQVRLDWDPNVEEDLAGYRVYRSTTPGSGYDKIASLGKGLTRYLDNDVLNGVTYYYVLTAFDEMDNESDYSNEVMALPSPPMPPSGGTLMPAGCSSPLFWALILLGLLLLTRAVGAKKAKPTEAEE